MTEILTCIDVNPFYIILSNEHGMCAFIFVDVYVWHYMPQYKKVK